MADKYGKQKRNKNQYNQPNEKKTEANTSSIPAAGDIGYEEVKKSHRLYFNLVKRRYIWFAISLVVIISGIISLSVQKLNLGIDFEGGSMYNIVFDKAVTQTQVSEAVQAAGLTSQVQLSNNNTEALIRTDALNESQRNALFSSLEKNVGTFDRGKIQEDTVGPSVGAEMRSNAIKALALAGILILLYISIRFRFAFAISGVLALFHDVLITVGIFSIFQWQIDATFIAAILTVFGYSINDTVVIFDRIRENEKRMKKKDSFEDVVDKSLWQTMGRSVKTTGTVLIALLAIFLLGGESTKGFALAMMIGVFAGAYSSIFIASQLVVEIKKRLSGDTKRKAPAEA